MRCQLYGRHGGSGNATHFVLGPRSENEWWFRELGPNESGEMQEIGEQLELDETTEELAREDAAAFGEKLRREGHRISEQHFAKVTFTHRPARRR